MKVCLLILLLLITLSSTQKQSGKDNWPSFRGQNAAGVADNQNLPDSWDGEKGTAIKWKVRIPGLAHSSPVVWEDKLFVTSAISGKDKATFKPGLYGAGDASEDKSVHQWKVFCLDKLTGKVIWDKVAYEGVPLEKRHVKSTYASSSPATDGRYVVAFFGSQGLYAFDMKGKLVWKKDLGRLDVGAYDLPEYEWGTASSPIIYKDLVIVQCDTSKEDFLMAINIKTGETVWKADRTEMPSWATPPVYAGKARTEIVTNAPNFIRGNDPDTGKELWKLGDSSNITAPTPIFSGELIVVASGRRPNAPVFVVRAGASGDITLPKDKTSSQHIAWSRQKTGSYMPTPLIYQGLLYVLKNEGIFTCFDLATGEEKYQSRIPHQGSGFSGSPVASDGKIYLPSEDGDIFVVKAGDKFELLGKNSIGQLLMATPAISGKMMFVRGERDLFAIGK